MFCSCNMSGRKGYFFLASYIHPNPIRRSSNNIRDYPIAFHLLRPFHYRNVAMQHLSVSEELYRRKDKESILFSW